MLYGAYTSAEARARVAPQASPPRRRCATTATPADGPQPRPPGPVRQAASFPSQTNTSPFPPEVWAQLDGIDLVEEFKSRVVTFVNIPHTIRREYIRVQGIALTRHHPSLSQFVAAHDERTTTRAGKLFLILSRMLLTKIE